MKPFRSISIAILLTILPHQSGAQWMRTNFPEQLVSCIAAKGGTLFAGTWGHGIYRSTDGGGTWTPINNGLPETVYGGYVLSLAVVPLTTPGTGGLLFAGMESGGIWRSDNDGDSWVWVYPGGKLGEHDISINKLLAAGNTVLAGVAQQGGSNGVYRAQSDGSSWTLSNGGFSVAEPNVRCFASVTVGSTVYFYVGADEGLYMSTSDGNGWTRISSGLPIQAISAVAATPGTGAGHAVNLFAAVRDIGIYRSTDNGATWSLSIAPAQGTSLYVSSFAVSPSPTGTGSAIFAASQRVIMSTDNGVTWEDLLLRDLYEGAGASQLVINGGMLYAGGYPFAYGVTKYWIGVDSGWVAQSSGTQEDLYTVKAVDNAVVWAGGVSGGVLRTTNGGTAWTSVGAGAIGTDPIAAIEAIDANTAWVSAEAVTQASMTARILKTTNGGASWTQVFTQPGGLICGIQMKTAQQGYAVGSPVGGKWTILKTTDGGSTWTHLATEPAQQDNEDGLPAVQLRGDTLWFGSSTGRVYRSVNLGTTWTSSMLPNTYVESLRFNSSTNGIFGSSSGIVHRSVNGGTTWDTVKVGTTQDITSIAGMGAEYWAAAGTGILYSKNSGQSWGYATPGFWGLSTLNAVAISPVASAVNGWAVGNKGVIRHYRRSATGIAAAHDAQPARFMLHQNYPNPFNPSTTITFNLPATTFVSLTVYDLIGREVATLASEEMHAGTHLLRWNAESRPSGVYFYRLRAGTFTETKKLQLIR